MNLLLHLVTSKECLGMVGHDNFHWVTKLIVLNNIVHGLFTCLQTTMYKCITHCLEEPVWVWTLVSNSGAADEFWPRVSEVTATEKWEQFNLSGMICCYWLKIWKDHLLMPEVFQICLACYQTNVRESLILVNPNICHGVYSKQYTHCGTLNH